MTTERVLRAVSPFIAVAMLALAGAASAGGAPAWEDDLEDAARLLDLFPADGSRFTQLQTEQGGACGLEHDVVRSGSSSVRCVAPGVGQPKADLGRQDVSDQIPSQPAPPRFGQTADQEIWAETWIYVQDAGRCEGLFLWDIEESAANNAGLRVHCKTDPQSGLDYLKMNTEFGPSYEPAPPLLQLPFDRWTRLRVYLKFHVLAGAIKLWLDDTLVLDATGRTARSRRAIYDSIQWGITVNASGRAQTVYVDDVSIWNLDPGW